MNDKTFYNIVRFLVILLLLIGIIAASLSLLDMVGFIELS